MRGESVCIPPPGGLLEKKFPFLMSKNTGYIINSERPQKRVKKGISSFL